MENLNTVLLVALLVMSVAHWFSNGTFSYLKGKVVAYRKKQAAQALAKKIAAIEASWSKQEPYTYPEFKPVREKKGESHGS